MRLYAKEKPKNCRKCDFGNTFKGITTCTLLNYKICYIHELNPDGSFKYCPLIPISDYKNEILKEVEKIIQEKISGFETISKEVPIANNEECVTEDKHEVKPFKNKKNGRVIEKKISKAMNEYKCEHCNGTILKNEKYMYVKTIIDGKFANIKLHQDCYNEGDLK